MQDQEIYGVELKPGVSEPTVVPRLPIKVHNLKIPLIKTNNSDNEEKVIASNFFIAHETWRSKHFSDIKETRTSKMPEHYYTDSLKDETELNTIKRDYDKFLLGLMSEYVGKNQSEKIIDLFDALLLNKSREIALKFVKELNENFIFQVLNGKMMRLRLREEKLKTIMEEEHSLNASGHKYINSNSKDTRDTRNSRDVRDARDSDTKESLNGINSLSALAISISGFKDLEEEVRNELGQNINTEGSNREDDYNALNVKQTNLNLEKKNVIIYI